MSGRSSADRSSTTITLFANLNTTFSPNYSFFKLQYFQIKMQFSVFSTGFLVAILASTALAAPPNLEKRIKAVSSKVQVENSYS